METITQRQRIDVDKDFERIRKNIIIPLEELYPLDKMVKCAREEYLKTICKYTYED